MPKLSDWKWCVDYSKSIGQKRLVDTAVYTGTEFVKGGKSTQTIGAVIAPLFFSSREKAQKHNKASFPKGRVVAVVIREKK